MELVIFLPAAALAVAAAITVITSRRAVYSALALLAVLASLAVMYLLLSAQFIAVLQVIIYAGAIVVLFLFVIMLLHMRPGEPTRDTLWHQRPLALVVGGLFLAGMTYAVLGGRVAPRLGVPAPDFGTAEGVGRALFTRFLLPFELASIILLVGIVAAVVLGKTPSTAREALPAGTVREADAAAAVRGG